MSQEDRLIFVNPDQTATVHTEKQPISIKYFLDFITEKQLSDATKELDSYVLAYDAAKADKENIKAVKEALERQLAHVIGDLLRLRTIPGDKNKELVYFTKAGKLEEDGLFRAESLAHAMLGPCINHVRLEKVKNLIKYNTVIDSNISEREPISDLCMRNCIVNVETKATRNFNELRDDEYHFSGINIDYRPEARCPNFEKYLETTLRKEDILLLQEFFGCCLYKHNKWNRMLILHGKGSNGKSVLLDIFDRIFQDSSVGFSINSFSDKKEDDFMFVNLRHKLICVSGDAGKRITSTDMIKKLTGNDVTNANVKGKNYIKFRNYAKFISSFNELPVVYDDSEGFWRRVIVIDFPYTFYQESNRPAVMTDFHKKADLNLARRIQESPEELQGIINWGLEGLKRLLDNGDFSVNETALAMREKWKMKSNSVSAFFDKCIDVKRGHSELYMTKTQLESYYKNFCELEDLPVNSKINAVGTEAYIRDIHSFRKIINTQKVQVFQEICLKEEMKDKIDYEVNLMYERD